METSAQVIHLELHPVLLVIREDHHVLGGLVNEPRIVMDVPMVEADVRDRDSLQDVHDVVPVDILCLLDEGYV